MKAFSVRHNNPGAIMYGPFAERHGAKRGGTGTGGTLAYFDTPAEGFAAVIALQNDYQNKGYRTLAQRIERWSPAKGKGNSAAATRNYINHVAAAMGIDPNAPFDINDPVLGAKFLKAQAEFEAGRANPFPDSELRAGLAAAQSGQSPVPPRNVGETAQGRQMPLGRGRGQISSGPAVRQLQQQLTDAGFDVGPRGIDGRFGKDTAAAVRAVERHYGLPTRDRGVAGPQVQAVLAGSGNAPVRTSIPAPRLRPTGGPPQDFSIADAGPPGTGVVTIPTGTGGGVPGGGPPATNFQAGPIPGRYTGPPGGVPVERGRHFQLGGTLADPPKWNRSGLGQIGNVRVRTGLGEPASARLEHDFRPETVLPPWGDTSHARELAVAAANRAVPHRQQAEMVLARARAAREAAGAVSGGPVASLLMPSFQQPRRPITPTPRASVDLSMSEGEAPVGWTAGSPTGGWTPVQGKEISLPGGPASFDVSRFASEPNAGGMAPIAPPPDNGGDGSLGHILSNFGGPVGDVVRGWFGGQPTAAAKPAIPPAVPTGGGGVGYGFGDGAGLSAPAYPSASGGSPQQSSPSLAPAFSPPVSGPIDPSARPVRSGGEFSASDFPSSWSSTGGPTAVLPPAVGGPAMGYMPSDEAYNSQTSADLAIKPATLPAAGDPAAGDPAAGDPAALGSATGGVPYATNPLRHFAGYTDIGNGVVQTPVPKPTLGARIARQAVPAVASMIGGPAIGLLASVIARSASRGTLDNAQPYRGPTGGNYATLMTTGGVPALTPYGTRQYSTGSSISNSPFTPAGYTAPSFDPVSGGPLYSYKPDGSGGGQFVDSQGRVHNY